MGCGLFKSSVTVEGEKYSIIKEIGEGGFSTIELAENTRSKHKVAIKRITCHSIEDQNAAKFEIEVHKKHRHESILQLLGSSIVGEADIVHNLTSQAFLVLPFYPCGTLHVRIYLSYLVYLDFRVELCRIDQLVYSLSLKAMYNTVLNCSCLDLNAFYHLAPWHWLGCIVHLSIRSSDYDIFTIS